MESANFRNRKVWVWILAAGFGLDPVDTSRQNNLKQLGIGLHNYHNANKCFPMGAHVRPGPTYSLGSMVALLPYVEQRAIYFTVDFDAQDCCLSTKSIQAAGKPNAPNTRINMYLCPSDPNAGRTLLAGPTGMMFTRSSTRFADVRDGTSQTLFFGERGLSNDLGWGWLICGGSECEQYLNTQNGLFGPTDGPTSSLTVSQYWSWHTSGVHFLLADGHVHFLNLNISYNTLKTLSTKSAKDLVGEF